MSKYVTMEKMINEIQSLMSKMQDGQLSAEELEVLVALTRDLHERALILRYKAYEQKVFGIISEVETEQPVVEVVEEVTLEPVLTEEIVADEFIVNEEVIQESITDEPIFGFDLFAANEEAEKDTFQVGEIVNESAIESPLAETPANSHIAEVEESEIHVTADVSDEIESPIVTIEEVTAVDASSQPVDESVPVVKEVFETKSVEPVSSTPNVLKHFQVITESTASFLHPKINSLTTAFGLNERLQCVRELFNGSSEAFVNTLEMVDKQSDFDSAKVYLSKIAIENKWNLEANLVKEFMLKIERRFL